MSGMLNKHFSISVATFWYVMIPLAGFYLIGMIVSIMVLDKLWMVGTFACAIPMISWAFLNLHFSIREIERRLDKQNNRNVSKS